jgi:D-glycero-alpha-D-manno-heptose-7-phosphate kinase
MIISRTPFRISFLGGGTDYPAWYRLHGGAVIAATIDKYCYLTCRYKPPFFDYRYRIVYSQSENCGTIDEISHPAVREVLKFLDVTRGLEIHHDGDLPARSGMGSSSAFTVGLLHVLHALQGRLVSKHQLAMEGITVEQDRLKEIVGSQDQVMAAYGGLNCVRFLQSGDISVHPITLRPERKELLDAHIMLFYTGIKRTASEVAGTYVADIESRSRQLRVFGSLVDEGLAILGGDKDLTLFGRLLHEAWQVKRSLSQSVSNARVDEIYQTALAAGAIGGKLLGAGGGGFLMLFVPPDRHQSVKDQLQGLLHVPCRFDSTGSQIVFFDPETDYADEEQLRAARPIGPFVELAKAQRELCPPTTTQDPSA